MKYVIKKSKTGDRISKAKYIKRWKGKDGKWKYQYKKYSSDKEIKDPAKMPINIERDFNTISKYAEKLFGKENVNKKLSNLSGSSYIEILTEGEDIKLRISDHDLPESYHRIHGSPDFDITPGGTVRDDSHGYIDDAMIYLSKKKGVKPPESAVKTSLERKRKKEIQIKESEKARQEIKRKEEEKKQSKLNIYESSLESSDPEKKKIANEITGLKKQFEEAFGNKKRKNKIREKINKKISMLESMSKSQKLGKPVDEAKWSEAKKKAEDQGQGGNYAYIMSIYKNMMGMNKSVKDSMSKDQKFVDLIMDKFGKDGKLNICGHYDLKKLDGYPQYVDLENCSILGIYPGKIILTAGGDWQQPINFTVERKGNNLIITEVAYHHEKQNKKERINRIKEIECQFFDSILGGKADGMTLEDIAKHHNVPVSSLEKEHDMGMKVEMEHTSDRSVAHEITLDHIYENKKYYSELKAVGLADELRKAKYIKKWKGKDGKWKYLYNKPKNMPTPQKEKTNLLDSQIKTLSKKLEELEEKRSLIFEEGNKITENIISKYGYNNMEWPKSEWSKVNENTLKRKEIDRELWPIKNELADLEEKKESQDKRAEKLKTKRSIEQALNNEVGIKYDFTSQDLTYKDLENIIKQIIIENKDKDIGVRFDKKNYTGKENIPPSKDNPEREDERDFPEFGTPEYESLPDLKGTSVWLAGENGKYTDEWMRGAGLGSQGAVSEKIKGKASSDRNMYIIIGDSVEDNSYLSDDGEGLFRNAKVIGLVREKNNNMKKSLSASDKKSIENFLKTYKGKMSDDDLHSFAESNGMNVHRVEEYIYEIARDSKKVNKSRGNVLLKNRFKKAAKWDRRYRLQGHKDWNGLHISIENRKGSIRRGKDPDGKPWKQKMKYAYGRIRGTEANDGEHVDAYIGPDKNSKRVFVVHQNNPWTGQYDEDKCLIQFSSPEKAKKAYLSQYNRPDFFGDMIELTVDEFKDALEQCKGKRLEKTSPVLKSMDDSFKPPVSVADQALRAIDAKSEYGKKVKGGTAVGWTRARQLANRENISMDTIKRMVSFFARHEGNQSVEAGKDWYQDAGAVAWALWGGNAGKAWANKILNQYEKMEKAMKKDLDYWKNRLISFLENGGIKKSLVVRMSKGRGLPVGTVRSWNGKKYIKGPDNKWKRKIEKDSRGAKQSVSAIKKKILKSESYEDLVKIIKNNKDRFSDENGKPLPFVKELIDSAKIKNAETGGQGNNKISNLSKKYEKIIKESKIKIPEKTMKRLNDLRELAKTGKDNDGYEVLLEKVVKDNGLINKVKKSIYIATKKRG